MTEPRPRRWWELPKPVRFNERELADRRLELCARRMNRRLRKGQHDITKASGQVQAMATELIAHTGRRVRAT